MAPHKIWTRGEKGPHFWPYLAYPGYFTLFVSRAGAFSSQGGALQEFLVVPALQLDNMQLRYLQFS